jgi:peptide/nickel transport system permease protein
VLRLALFVLRRLLAIVVLAWVVTLAAFGLFRVGVENPATTAQINAQLGVGEPAPVQYLHYLMRLLHGDLGQTLTVGVSVDHLLQQALPPTLSLIIGGMVLWLAAGTVIGAVSALQPGSWTDKSLSAGALAVTLILPTFLIAVLLLDLFSYLARSGILWMQPGYVPFTRSPGQWLGRMILPWIAIAAAQVGLTARLTRSTVIEVLSEEYVRTARAKGLGEERVFWVHVLRPAVTPVLASISTGFGTLLGSAAIVDQVFALGGIGQQLLTGVRNGDLMLIMGTALLTVILISLVNLITDICQALVDPRVQVT